MPKALQHIKNGENTGVGPASSPDLDSLPLGSVYIGGRWVRPSTTTTISVEDPTTEQIVAQVPAGGAEDIDRAVTAARAAFPRWAASSVSTRIEALSALRTLLSEHGGEMARLITQEMGSPTAFAQKVQVGLPVRVLESYIAALESSPAEERIGHSVVLREAAGVVGAITPWNYPLHQAVAKIGAAFAAGCTVVLKPSEIAPLSGYLLTTLIDRIGLPDGVFNLVPGTGTDAGQALAGHNGVDVVSFTGSVTAGRQVAGTAAATIKKLCLELGGKSATLVLPDADLAIAVQDSVGSCLHNAGQTCSARSRLLVPQARLAEAVDLIRDALAGYAPGDPTQPDCRLGPLASRAQRERVLGYLRRAAADGATRIDGGETGPLPGTGYFVAPSAWIGVDPDSPLARDEIFGPVLSVITYTDEAEAVDIVNRSDYGLAAAVWSADTERAVSVARRLRVGQIDINGGKFNAAAPFGGYKQSGVGRELGRYGIEEFQEIKSLQLPL